MYIIIAYYPMIFSIIHYFITFISNFLDRNLFFFFNVMIKIDIHLVTLKSNFVYNNAMLAQCLFTLICDIMIFILLFIISEWILYIIWNYIYYIFIYIFFFLFSLKHLFCLFNSLVFKYKLVCLNIIILILLFNYFLYRNIRLSN